jgi:hypothetical protein
VAVAGTLAPEERAAPQPAQAWVPGDDSIYRLQPAGAAPPGHPRAPLDDPHAETPFAASFAERREAFLAHVRRAPTPTHIAGVFHELARLAAGGTPWVAVFEAALDHIDARRDCADFVMHAILRLLHQFPDHSALPQAFWARARASVIGFKYWPDES